MIGTAFILLTILAISVTLIIPYYILGIIVWGVVITAAIFALDRFLGE